MWVSCTVQDTHIHTPTNKPTFIEKCKDRGSMEPGLSVFIVQEKETGHTEYIKLFLKLHDLGLAGWLNGE